MSDLPVRPARPDEAGLSGARIDVFGMAGGQPFFDDLVDRFYEGVEDDHYLCRDCGRRFFICWDREEELPKELFHPEVRKIPPPPQP